MKNSVTNNIAKSIVNPAKGLFANPEVQLLVFVIANILIFLVLFPYFYKIQYTGTYLYFQYASRILDGQLPYLDFTMEYPPLALFFFILPRLAASVYKAYVVLYNAEILIFELLGLYLIYFIACRLGKSPWRMLAAYTLSILAIGPIIAQQYDIFPAILTLLSLYCFWVGKHKTSWAFLALGTLTKLYPVVIAPVFFIVYLRNRQYRRMWTGIITFGVICLATVIPFMVVGSDSIWNLINYHSQRGIQLESTYSVILLLLEKMGLVAFKLVFNYGSWNVSGHLADTIARFSPYLTVFLLLMAYWFIYRHVRPGKSQNTRLGAYSLLVVTITLITSKVFSPQYLIWLIPLIPLVIGPRKNMVLLIFIGIGAFTYFIFPHYYISLLNLDPGVVAVLMLRNLMIVILALMTIKSLNMMKPSD